MRGITLVGATPSRLAVLYRHIANEKDKAQNRKQLAALMGPKSLTQKDDADEDNAFTDCLAVGKELGFFSEKGEIIQLTNPSRAAEIAESFEDELAFQLVDNVQSAFSSNGNLAGAIAWMLVQDPRTPLKWTGSSSIMLLKRQFREDPELNFGMSNDSRFQQAVYWARTLGFVTRVKLKDELVVPDPTRAIERRLHKILPPRKDTLLRTFLSDLAGCCPVFEDGSVRLEVERLMHTEFQREASAVSKSTALSLLRLQLRGTIELKRLDDGQVLFVEGAMDGGRVSHISRN